MFKKTVKYTNFDGETRSRDLYFNLTEAECAELEASDDNSLSKKIEIIVNADDRKEIVEVFKAILLKAYGERSADGETFMKSHEISHKFECSAAYNSLFMELATDSEKMANFINAVIPNSGKVQNHDSTAAFKQVANS